MGLTRAWVQILDGTLPWGSLWIELYCSKEFFKQASTSVGNTLWMLYIMNVWMKEKKFQKSGGGRTYNHVFTSPLLYHRHQQIFILKVNHAQFKQNNYKRWKAGWEPWTYGLPAFYSTIWATLTVFTWRNCWIFKLVVTKMFKLVSLWTLEFIIWAKSLCAVLVAIRVRFKLALVLF